MLALPDGYVGGADQRELTLVGDDEDDALVAVLQDEGVIALVEARHDDVAALDQTHAFGGLDLCFLIEEALHPGACGIDQAARLEVDGKAAGSGEFDVPQPAVLAAAGGDAAMAGIDLRAHLPRRLQVGDHQPGVVHPGVGVDETLLKAALQAGPELGARQVDGDRPGQGHVPVEMIVEPEAEPQHPSRPQVRFVRQHEAQRPRQVGRLGEQHFALLQRLADQAKFIGFQVAQAAMDQFGRAGRGRAGEIVHLAEADPEGPSSRVAGDARAVDTAADHEQVERLALHSTHGFTYSPLDPVSQEPQMAAWVSCSKSCFSASRFTGRIGPSGTGRVCSIASRAMRTRRSAPRQHLRRRPPSRRRRRPASPP